MSERKKRKRLKFVHVLLIGALLCVIAGLYALAFLWSYLDEYEKASPKAAVREIAVLLEKGDYRAAQKLGGIDGTVFYDENQYRAYMERQLGAPGPLAIQEVGSEKAGERRYKLTGSGGEGVLYTVTKSETPLKYGFSLCEARQDEVPVTDYTIAAPESAAILVNGVPLSAEAKTGKTSPVSSYEVLKDESRIPSLTFYQVEGFAVEPEIRLEGPAVITRSGRKVLLLPEAEGAEKREIEALAAEAAEVYAKFTSRDATREELTAYLYRDTEFYKRMGAFDNSWFVDHSEVQFRAPRFENTVVYSPNHISTEIRFDYYVRANRTEKIYPTHYRMSFFRQGEKYWVANIEIL